MAGCWEWLCLPRQQLPQLRNRGNVRRGNRCAVQPLGFFQKRVHGCKMAQGKCRLVIVALDYKGSEYELNCTVDGDHVQALARQCGVHDVTVAYNEECTPAKFREMLRSVGARCQPDDTLLFYFSGHGTCVKDLDGDGDDGMDEAFVLVNDDGEINLSTTLVTDDEFVQIMMDAVPPQTTIITICDCCHSGTIMDFNKSVWTNRKAVSISGSRDAQTSGETDGGGICTHSILLAIESLQRQGFQSYPIKKLFKETFVQEEAVFSGEQDITLNRSAGCMQMGIPWPLVPKTLYTAPYRRPGYMSNKTSTTTAAPVDAPAPHLRMLPKLDMPVVARSSSSPRPLRQASPLRSPLAGTGTQPLVASQPPFTALPNNGSASIDFSAGVHSLSSSGPCLPASVSLHAGVRRQSSSSPCLSPASPAGSAIPGFHALKAGQHSSCSSPRYPALYTPSMTPQKQWALQRQQKQQVVFWRAT